MELITTCSNCGKRFTWDDKSRPVGMPDCPACGFNNQTGWGKGEKEKSTPSKSEKTVHKSKHTTGAAEQLVEALFKEGTNLYENRKFDKAEKKLKSALKLDPSSEDIMYNLALVYLELGKHDQAQDLINKIKYTNCDDIIAVLKKEKKKQWSSKRRIAFWIGFSLGMLFGISAVASGGGIWGIFSGAGLGTGLGLVFSLIAGIFD